MKARSSSPITEYSISKFVNNSETVGTGFVIIFTLLILLVIVNCIVPELTSVDVAVNVKVPEDSMERLEKSA